MKKLVTFFLVAVFLLAMYVPVSAAQWDMYGSARVTTFWTDMDEADTMNLNHNLQSNARIGANVKNGAIGGRFEYGTGVNTRLLYGTVDLGAGQLLVGQAYGPFGIGSFISNQVYGSDTDLLYFLPYTGRVPMVQYSVEGLKIALVKPVTAAYPKAYELDDTFDALYPELAADLQKQLRTTTDGNPEILLPQLQLSYDMKMDAVALNFAGAFQSYDLANGDGDTLTAWAVGTNVRLTMMDPMYINFGGFFGQNAGNFGQWTAARADITDPNNIEDADTYGAALVLGTKLDTLGLEAGVGFRNDEIGDVDTDLMAYYLQATIPLSQDGKAFIVPEVGMFDYEEEDELYAGLKWQINF